MKRLSLYIMASVVLITTLSVTPQLSDFLPVRSPDPAFATIPTNMNQFLELREKLGYTPEGGTAVFIVAMMIFTQNEELGKECITVALDHSRLMKNTGGYKGYAPEKGFKYYFMRLRDFPYIPYSYIQGATPRAGYNLPQQTWIIPLSLNPFKQIDPETVVLYVSSSGSDTPREVTLRRNNHGIWKVQEYSKLFFTVAPPERVQDDRL